MALNFRKADRLRKNFNGCEITMETFERELCVRGYHVYHVYQRIWTAAVGEVLHCEREPTNSRDRYAVAVKNIRALNFRKPGHLRKYCNTTKISRSISVRLLLKHAQYSFLYLAVGSKLASKYNTFYYSLQFR